MTIHTATMYVCKDHILCTTKTYGTYSNEDMNTYVRTIHKVVVSVQYLRQRKYENIHTSVGRGRQLKPCIQNWFEITWDITF